MATTQKQLRALRAKMLRFPVARQIKEAFAGRRGKAGPRAELVNEELLGRSSGFCFGSLQC
jgi:hypothetical protein